MAITGSKPPIKFIFRWSDARRLVCFSSWLVDYWLHLSLSILPCLPFFFLTIFCSTTKLTFYSVSCLFSIPVYFLCILSSSWPSTNWERKTDRVKTNSVKKQNQKTPQKGTFFSHNTKKSWQVKGKLVGDGILYLFWGVLLFGCDVAELVVHSLPVLLLLHSIDSHQPVLGSKRLLKVFQTDVLVADLSIPCPVKPRWCTEVQLHTRAES